MTGYPDHPLHDALVAYVDGRVDAADREWIESHADDCRICAEDISDLRDMQRALTPMAADATPAPVRRPRWLLAGSAVAAAAVVLIWFARPQHEAPVASEPASVSAAAPSPPAAPLPPSSPLTDHETALMASAIERGLLPRPSFDREIRLPAGTLLSERDSALTSRLTGPVGTAIDVTRPTFRWTPVSDATSYTVSVFDESFSEVASSGPLTGTSWTADVNLPRGRVLSWQVAIERPSGRITSPSPPQPEARFVVLSTERAQAIAAARTRLASDPLALALVLSEAGLYEDAGRVLSTALSDQRYDQAQIKRLLASLR